MRNFETPDFPSSENIELNQKKRAARLYDLISNELNPDSFTLKDIETEFNDLSEQGEKNNADRDIETEFNDLSEPEKLRVGSTYFETSKFGQSDLDYLLGHNYIGHDEKNDSYHLLKQAEPLDPGTDEEIEEEKNPDN